MSRPWRCPLGSAQVWVNAGGISLAVAAFARDLDHPRWLLVLPNGDVLVADDVGNVIWRVTAAPLTGEKPADHR